MTANHSPVALFVYNRPIHTLRVLEALVENEGADSTPLYIFADGPKNDTDKNVEEVRKVISAFKGFKSKTIIAKEKNIGLAESIITGVEKVLEQHETVIVLEDDIVTSPQFLNYMNSGLEKYSHEESVISINAYMYPINGLAETFFLKNADCWGWATWRRGWRFFEKDGQKLLNKFTDPKLITEFNIDNTYPYHQMLQNQVQGKNNSWAIRWYASAFLNNKLGLYVGKSLIENIGLDNSGENCGEANQFKVNYSSALPSFPSDIKEDLKARKAMAKFQRESQHGLFKKMKAYYAKIKNKIFP